MNKLKFYFRIWATGFISIFLLSCCATAEDQDVNRGKNNSLSASLLDPFVATYMVSSMGLEGIQVTNTLTLDGDKKQSYHFKSYSIPVGLLALKKDETRDEQSEGGIINNTIQPERYIYVQIREGKTRRDVELKFDWQKKQVSNHHKHKQSKWRMPIKSHTVDKLSYQLSLMLRLKKASINNNKDKHFSLFIADGGKLKSYDFTILDEEQINTPLGKLETIKITHKRHNTDKVITLWCAPKLNYLPVKIIQDEKDKPQFLSTLTSYKKS